LPLRPVGLHKKLTAVNVFDICKLQLVLKKIYMYFIQDITEQEVVSSTLIPTFPVKCVSSNYDYINLIERYSTTIVLNNHMFIKRVSQNKIERWSFSVQQIKLSMFKSLFLFIHIHTTKIMKINMTSKYCLCLLFSTSFYCRRTYWFFHIYIIYTLCLIEAKYTQIYL